MANTCYEIKWLIALMQYFNVSSVTPVALYCDNNSSLHIAKNPVFHECTKHVGIDCHLVRAMLLEGVIFTSYISTQSQPADIFTEALSLPQFTHLMSKLRVLNLFSTHNLREDVKDYKDSTR